MDRVLDNFFLLFETYKYNFQMQKWVFKCITKGFWHGSFVVELVLRLPGVTVLWKGAFGPASPSEGEFAAEVPFGSLSELCFDIFIFGSFTI